MGNFTALITDKDIDWLDDYDDKKVNAIIKNVQLLSIKPIFQNYYEYLIAGFENDDLKKCDKVILDEYITPMMSLLCENSLLIKSPIKINTTGTRMEFAEETEIISSSKIQAVVTNNTQDIETYKRSMIAYMKSVIGIFPAFVEDNDCLYPDDAEEVFNMSTVHGVYRQPSIYK